MIPLSVRAVGMVSSVGNTAPECFASVGSGVARIAETALMSREGSPIRMGTVPPGSLPALPGVDAAPRTTRHRRTVRLAHAALTEALDAETFGSVPLLAVTGLDEERGELALDDLASLAGGRIDRAASRNLDAGAAGAFLALLDAAHRITRGEADAVLVVGADTMIDLARLDALQTAGRILVDSVMDGFIPGEGAAALLVTAAAPGALATLAAVGAGDDPFRCGADVALTGDGLTRAVHSALDGASEPVSTAWCGLNGESWTAREWGIAARRVHRALAGDMGTKHPAACFGDPGAALGAMLLVLAVTATSRGIAGGGSLVWALSEDGLRGAARVERAA